MAEIVNVVQQGFDCQMCGHAWVPMPGRKPPRRCPNHACRSMRWDAQKYPNAGPPRPPSPTGGGAFDNGDQGGGGLPRTCYQTLAPAARKPAVPASNQPLHHQAAA
jgi:hypothetical protein